jgi:hypothetical protein
MENPLSMEVYSWGKKTSVNGQFSIAMLKNQRVYRMGKYVVSNYIDII